MLISVSVSLPACVLVCLQVCQNISETPYANFTKLYASCMW